MDCDSFYASVELLRRPELRGRPVVVSGTGPRAVVTTASYEARRFGVHSAMPASHARRLCPAAVFIPPDFAAYRAKSKEVWETVQDRLGCPMQQVSLDEAYLDITAVERPLPVVAPSLFPRARLGRLSCVPGKRGGRSGCARSYRVTRL